MKFVIKRETFHVLLNVISFQSDRSIITFLLPVTNLIGFLRTKLIQSRGIL